MRRTDEQRLELFARRMDGLAAEPGLGHQWSWQIHFEGDHATTTYDEPRREDVRSLLIEVRKLDSPGEDLYLPGILDLLSSRAADPVFQAGLKDARRHYDENQGLGDFHYADDDGPMTLREAFEIWVYGGILHDDYDKEQRWKGAWLAQPFIRSNAVAYMGMLLTVGSYCRAVIERDPALSTISTSIRTSRT
jgi:hypothetical protein